MHQFTLTDLAKIIERESKDSTYKFALLRGTIDIIQNSPNLKEYKGDMRFYYPMGLLILKWIEYYFPLFENEIPQRPGRTAFDKEITDVINLYSKADKKFSSLQYDLKRGVKGDDRSMLILKLLRKVRDTIVKQPMYYIGSSIGQSGSLYTYKSAKSVRPHLLNLDYVIRNFGIFGIPIDFHDVLSTVGSFVAGSNSILFKWAEFSSRLTDDLSHSSSRIIELLSDHETSRDVVLAKDFFVNILEQEKLHCIWSGKQIAGKNMHIDHILPFSAIRNNDLWNLLPADEHLNIKKSDSIPSPELLMKEKVKNRIVHYWEQIALRHEEQFFQEAELSLTGISKMDKDNWKNLSYSGLIDLSKYLIENRGLNPWNYQT